MNDSINEEVARIEGTLIQLSEKVGSLENRITRMVTLVNKVSRHSVRRIEYLRECVTMGTIAGIVASFVNFIISPLIR